ATFDRIAEINFNLDADDNSANATAFEACCKERIRQFDDAEEEEDIWEEKEINYATQVKSRTRFGVSHTSESSSRSSLENGGRERDRGSGSDEDDDPRQSASDPGSLKESKDNTPSPSWTASFGEAGGNSSSPGPAGWDSPGGSGGDKQEAGWANFTEFQPFSSPEVGPRCSSPVGSSDADKQVKPGPDKSAKGIVCPGASPSPGGEWPVGEGRKAPLVASDSSSSGGSDSEEDDKTAAAAAKETTSSRANKKAEVKSENPIPLEKLSLTDAPKSPPKAQLAADTPPASTPTPQTDNKEDPPQCPEMPAVNGPV
ncbi:unnamed protein product, partial [Oncorhynchus mykiss]